MGEVDPQLMEGCFIEQIVFDAFEHTIAEPATHGTNGQQH